MVHKIIFTVHGRPHENSPVKVNRGSAVQKKGVIRQINLPASIGQNNENVKDDYADDVAPIANQRYEFCRANFALARADDHSVEPVRAGNVGDRHFELTAA